jgi:hypothetical protein
MEYLNLKLSTLGDIRYIGSPPVFRATWLNLLAYCAKMENGGLIETCLKWGDGTWGQIAGLKRKEVHAVSTLWEWEGENLRVWGYPIENQRIYHLRREIGRTGGLKSGESRRSTKIEANGEPIASPNAEPIGSYLVERKGKEREGKESNTTTTTTTEPAILSRGCTLPEALDYAIRYNTSEGLAAGRQIPDSVARLWHDSRLAAGWMNVKSGLEMPIADWQADLRTFAHRYAQNEKQVPLRSGGHRSSAGGKIVTLTTEEKNGF